MESDHIIKCVVFDCGGVLAPSSLPTQITGMFSNISDDEKMQLSKSEKLAWGQCKVGKMSGEEFFRILLKDTNRDESTWKSLHEKYIEFMTSWRHSRAQKVSKLLDSLTEQGYLIAVISNHCSEWLWAIFDSCGYTKKFNPSLVIVSDKVGLAKPQPEIFEHFLTTLKKIDSSLSAKNCLFIDDKQTNIEVACSLGFKGFVYDAGTENEDQLMKKFKEIGGKL
eukprot:c12907_g1_i1.p1 GENE.c12907_g1_i1~~c12907_g1_i1.p1  ORF type:complete len:223 (+),score=95.26 c12907_g1_i1:37-705(+)